MSNGTDGMSVVQQIVHQFRSRIRSGELRPGQRLPTQAELVNEYKATTTTIRKAMVILRGESLIETHKGVGSFVRYRHPTRRIMPRPGADTQNSTYLTKIVKPILSQPTHTPTDKPPPDPAESTRPIHVNLINHPGPRTNTYQTLTLGWDIITARMPTPEEARRLRLRRGTPVIAILTIPAIRPVTATNSLTPTVEPLVEELVLPADRLALHYPSQF